MKSGELEVFASEEFGQVRTIEIDNEPYFVGKDVAEILGYSRPLDALNRHVDGDDSVKHGLIDSMGRPQKTILINESGLYSLILSSKLPTAKRFKRWVTSEVLPAIRKKGLYATEQLLDNPDLFIAILEDLKKERLSNKIKDQQILELKPKASYYDLVLQTPDLISISVIAKDYGMSGRALNKVLNDLGIQYKRSDIWLLYSKYQSEGYTQTKTCNYIKNDGNQGASVHTYWTQKGRLFLYDKLKANGFLPMIEKQAA